jgi:hypothetical protein
MNLSLKNCLQKILQLQFYQVYKKAKKYIYIKNGKFKELFVL